MPNICMTCTMSNVLVKNKKEVDVMHKDKTDEGSQVYSGIIV